MLKNYFFVEKLVELCREGLLGQKIIDSYAIGKERFYIRTQKNQLFIHMHGTYPFLIVEKNADKPAGFQPYFPELNSKLIEKIDLKSNSRQIAIQCEDLVVLVNLYDGQSGIQLNSDSEHFFKSQVIDKSNEELDLAKALALIALDGLTIEQVRSTEHFYSRENEQSFSFSLFAELFKAQEIKEYRWSENANNAFYNCMNFIRRKALIAEISKALKPQLKYLKSSLKKIDSTKIDESEKKALEEKGHLILSHMHLIKKGDTSVKLKNIFTSTQEMIEIPLNPKLNAQKNAEKYYTKASAFDQNKKALIIRRANYQKKYDILFNYLEELNTFEQLKDLEKLKKKLIREQLLKKDKRNLKTVDRKYIEFEIDNYPVFVGKDAKSNDYLTLKFSKGNDYWFHVQGSPGSHVILRWHDEKDNPPKALLEKVAALTAYYSKQKNAGTVPVIYTLAKHVRKPRGAAAGAVSVSKEKSIYVKPKAFEDL